jgi:hypothetical protein
MPQDIALNRGDYGDRSWIERAISRLELIGLNAARLILALAVTLSVIFLLLGLAGLALQGLRYGEAVSPTKYQINSISFTPNFANLLLNGSPQQNPDQAIAEDRAGAAVKNRNQLISDRLAYMREFGLCISGSDGKCLGLGDQESKLFNEWGNNDIRYGLPQGSHVAYANGISIPDMSSYYGAYGFGSQEDALKAERDAVNHCLGAYKAKNGNLYIQNAPELFSGILAECDQDYNNALNSELKSRPSDWTFIDTARTYALLAAVGGLLATIIFIALTIIFFRLEVSFRALRNLSRLN